MVCPFLASRVGESSHPAHTHPNREIDSFDMRRADTPVIGIAKLLNWDHLHDLAGTIALLSLTRRRIDLNQLGEVDAAK